MIRPTTPTSAGWAQAFDTSGYVEQARADREKQAERFDKNIKEFDSSQVWHRDIPEFTNKVNEYYGYISENYDALKNKTRNLDKYYKMKGMENELMNFSVASKAMGQNVDKAQKLMLDKPELYDTPENRALIDGIITGSAYGEGGLSQGYKERTALNNSFMKDFGRNIFIDTPEIKERMMEYAQPDIEDVQTATIEGRRKASQYRYKYDVEGMAGELQEMWKNGYTSVRGDVSSNDLQRKYEGDFEQFATAMTDGLPEFTDPKEFTTPSEDDGSKIDYRWEATPQPSGTSVIAQHQTTVTKPAQKVLGITTRKEQTTPLTQSFVYTPKSEGNVSVYGTKSIFKRKAGASGGWDMRDNIWSEVNLTDDNLSQLTNVDHGYLAESPIFFPVLTMKDEQGKNVTLRDYTAPKGAALSDEMIAAIDAGGVSYVDESGVKQPLMRDVNAEEHVFQGPIAYSRNASYASGFDIRNPLSYMNSLTGKQYRSMAEPWEEYKLDVQMHPAQIEDVERQLGVYNVSDHYATPLIPTTPSGEIDFDALDAAAQEAANTGQ
jgi:hypothetical protein